MRFIQKYHQVNKPQLMHQANKVIFCCGQKEEKELLLYFNNFTSFSLYHFCWFLIKGFEIFYVIFSLILAASLCCLLQV